MFTYDFWMLAAYTGLALLLCLLAEVYQLFSTNDQMKVIIESYSLLRDRDISFETSRLEDLE